MLPIATAVEQVATHLREEISAGRWGTLLPGRKKLVKELGVNGDTIERAIQQLEKEGILKSQGKGKRRLSILHLNHVFRVNPWPALHMQTTRTVLHIPNK
jgi:DNA-binding transcriptional MocR family regulator